MLNTIAQKFRAYRSHRIAADHLHRMADRDLNDIGVARQDIELVVRRGRLQF